MHFRVYPSRARELLVAGNEHGALRDGTGRDLVRGPLGLRAAYARLLRA